MANLIKNRGTKKDPQTPPREQNRVKSGVFVIFEVENWGKQDLAT